MCVCVVALSERSHRRYKEVVSKSLRGEMQFKDPMRTKQTLVKVIKALFSQFLLKHHLQSVIGLNNRARGALLSTLFSASCSLSLPLA